MSATAVDAESVDMSDEELDEWNVAVARDLAYEKHAKQKDKSGRPYREHLLGVYRGVVVLGGSAVAQQAAFLHDIIEDTSVTARELLEEHGFSEEVVAAVVAVTKTTSEEQGKYLQRVIDAGEDAMYVKLADLLHNTRPDRMAELSEQTRTRLLKKYRPAMARLLLELGRIVDDDEQAKIATKPAGSATGPYWGSSSEPGAYHYSQDPMGRTEYLRSNEVFKGDWIEALDSPVAEIHHEEKGQGRLPLATYFVLEDGTYAMIEPGRSTAVWWAQDVEARRAKDPQWAPRGTTSWGVLHEATLEELRETWTRRKGSPSYTSGKPDDPTAQAVEREQKRRKTAVEASKPAPKKGVQPKASPDGVVRQRKPGRG